MADYVSKYLKKEKDKEKESTSGQRDYVGRYVFENQKKNANAVISDSQDYLRSLAERATSTDFDSAKSYAKSAKENDINRRVQQTRAWVQSNKDRLGDDYDRYMTYLNGYGENASAYDKYLSNRQKYYSQFADEGEYNRAVKEQTYRDKYSGKSYADLMANYDKADANEKAWIDANKEAFMTDDDMRKEIEAYGDTGVLKRYGNAIAKLIGNIHYDNNGNLVRDKNENAEKAVDDYSRIERYKTILADNEARKSVEEAVKDSETAEILSRYNEGVQNSDRGYNFNFGGSGGAISTDTGRTAGEVKKAQALKELEAKGYSADEAKKLAEDYVRISDKNFQEYLNEQQYDLAKDYAESARDIYGDKVGGVVSGIAGATGSTLGKFATMPSSLADTARDLLNGNEVNPYSTGHIGQNLARQTDEAIQGTYDWNVGGMDLYDFGYGVLESVEDNLLRALVTGGNATAIGGLMSAEVFDQAIVDGKLEGKSNSTALADAIVQAAIEGITEKYSMEYVLKPDKAKSVIGGIVKSMLAEGSEEVASDALNDIYDNLVNGKYSEIQTKVRDYLAEGYSQEEASKLAFKDVMSQYVQDGLAGAVSGGILGGGVAVDAGQSVVDRGLSGVSNAVSDRVNANALANNDVLRSLAESKASAELGEYERLVENADDSRKSKRAIKKAAKNVVKQTRKNISAEDRAIMDTKVAESIKADTKNEYTEQDRMKAYKLWRDGKSIAPYYQKVLSSMNGFEDAVKSANTAINEQAEERTFKAIENATRKKSAADTSGFNKGGVGTTVEYNGENATIKNIDGGNVVLSNGETVDYADVKMSDAMATVVVQTEELAKAYNLSSAQTESIISDAETIIEANPDANADYVMFAIEDAMKYGSTGFENGFKNGTFTSLFKDNEIAQRVLERVYNEANSKRESVTQRKNKGKGTTSYIGEAEKSLNKDNTRKVQADYVSKVVNEMGVNLVFGESKNIDGKFVMIDENGNEHTENGNYDPKTNTIYIDINSGNLGTGLIIFTAAHELTHAIRANNSKGFNTFADYLLSHYSEGKLNALMRAKANALGLDMQKDYDTIYEEVVADSCERFLLDGNLAERLTELKNADTSLFNKVKNYIQKLIDAFKALKSDIGVQNLINEHKEADIVKSFEDYDKLINLWEDALIEIAEGNTTVISDTNSPMFTGMVEMTDGAETTDGEKLFQWRAMAADEDQYRRILEEHGQMSEKEINGLFKTIDNIIGKITESLENEQILDFGNGEEFDPNVEQRSFFAMKSNSDPLYKVSLDFSTLCRKRLLQQTIAIQLQNALNRNLTKAENIAIRNELARIQNEGRQIEIACALCYVEAARMKSPAQINKFLENRDEVLHEYFANKNSPKNAKVEAELKVREKLAKKYTKEIADDKYADPTGYTTTKSGKKVYTPLKYLPSFMQDEIRQAKKNVNKEYKPTAEENKMLKVVNELDASMFTSVDGLAELTKEYPLIFDAFTSYVRNATKSKSMEKDTWWRYGDSEKATDTLIEAMNTENGLRSQSWSDFQVIHLLDYIAATIELSTRNAKLQTYTKVPASLKLMGHTNAMINLSLIPTVNYNGTLEYDGVEGMPFDTALELRDKYHKTAGTICIGIKNEQIVQLLASNLIDYVIPYHHSGMSAVTRRLIMGNEVNWDNYQDYQSEKSLKGNEAKANAKRFGAKLLSETDEKWHKHPTFSEWYNEEEAIQIAKEYDSKKNLTESEARAKEKYGIQFGGYMAMQEMAERYKTICAERGLSPKFSTEGKADFTGEENYWKLLIDRKMVDNVDGGIIQQKALTPKFSEADIMDILNEELDNYKGLTEDFQYATKKVVDKYTHGQMTEEITKIAKALGESVPDEVNNLSAVSAVGEVKKSERFSPSSNPTTEDNEYLKAINNGDMEKAQSFVEKAAERWGAYSIKGKPLELYHGTASFGFTEFDLDKMDDKRSIFMTSNLDVAKTYSYGKGRKYVSREAQEKASAELNKAYEEQMEKVIDFLHEKINEDYDFRMNFETTNNDFVRLEVVDDFFDTFLEEYYERNYNDASRYGYGKDKYESLFDFQVSDEAEKLEDEYRQLTDKLCEIRAEFGDENNGAYALYTKVSHPFVINAKGQNWNHVPVPSYLGLGDTATTRQICDYAASQGKYDGVVFENIVDNGGRGRSTGASDYIVVAFNPSDVKSADTVTYDDNGNVIPLSERFSESEDIRYSERFSTTEDKEYLKAVESGDEKKAERLVEQAAKAWGAFTDSKGNPLKLYHGTRRFGWTIYRDENFDVPFIYTTTDAEGVALNYSRGASQRPIGRYQGGNSLSSIISDAKLLMGWNYSVATETDRKKAYEKGKEIAFERADKIAQYEDAVRTLPNDIRRHIENIQNIFYTLATDLDYAEAKEDKIVAELEEYESRFRESRNALLDVVNGEFTSEQKRALKFYTSLDVNDAVADLENTIGALQEGDALISDKGDFANPQKLREWMAEVQESGIYDLYGNIGNNPLVFDAKGANFTSLLVLEIDNERHGTDYVADWAYKNGYTGVIMKNIRDYGEVADNYVFFDSSQIKSADTVTYDDNGNVIPLSERFSESKDIRYSERISPEQYDEMKEHFGTTNNFKFAGYMLEDGTMLDFSGKHWGDIKPTSRQVDHRDISEVLQTEYDGADSMLRMMNNGNIRMSHETNGVNLITKPTEKQMQKLREYFDSSVSRLKESGIRDLSGVRSYVDIDDENGRTIHSFEYSLNTPAERIMNDIVNYFDNGTVPSADTRSGNTNISDFLFSERDQTFGEVNARMIGENEKLKKLVKLQRTLTHGKLFTRSSVEAQASKFMKEYGINRGKGEIADMLNNLYEFIASNEELNWEDVMTRADRIAKEIVERSEKYGITDEGQEVLDYLKGAKVKLTDTQKQEIISQYGSLKAFRDKFMGRIVFNDNGVDFDSWWKEASEVMPHIFDENINEGDMPSALADILESAKEPQLLTSADGMQRVIADEIYDSYWDVSTLHTFADAKQKEINQLKAKHREQMAEIRAKRDEKIKEIRQKNKESRHNASERRQKTVVRNKIKKLISTYESMLTNPNKNKRVPARLVNSVIDALKVINIDSGRAKTSYRAELLSKLEAVERMYKSYESNGVMSQYFDEVIYERIKAEIDNLKENLPNDVSLYNKELSLEQLQSVYESLKSIGKAIRDGDEVRLGNERIAREEFQRDATAETKSISNKMINPIKRFIFKQLSAERMFNTFGNYAHDSAWNKLYRILNNGQLKATQLRMEATKYFQDLLEGENLKKMEKMQSTKKEDLVDIGFVDENGNNVLTTRAMMLSIAMHLRNEDNMRHLLIGGLTVPDLARYYSGKSEIWGTGSVRANVIDKRIYDLLEERQKLNEMGGYEEEVKRLTEEINSMVEDGMARLDQIAKTINDGLTDYEKEWLERAQKFFDEWSKNNINATTMEMYDFAKAIVDNYFPIHTDPKYREAMLESIKKDLTLENAGWLKERIHASNPVLLEDLTDVINTQINQVSRFCGLAPAIKEFNKVYGGKSMNDSMNARKALNDKFGSQADKYIEDLLADLQGARGSNEFVDRLFGKLRGAMAQATLTMNLRVALAQAASYPTASVVVGHKALAKALVKGGKDGKMFSKADKRLIEKYSPLLWYRLQGNMDIDIANIKDQKFLTKANRKLSFLTNWIQQMDGMTVGRLWYAAEYYVQDELGISKDNEEKFYTKVAEVFNDIVERTQPNYTTMQRPEILRTKSPALKMLTMFMTQRLQNFNILYDATSQLVADVRGHKQGKVSDEQLRKSKKKMASAVSSQMVATMTITVMKGLVDALLHNLKRYKDDDDEVTAESAIKTLSLDYLNSVVSNVVLGSELYDIIYKIITGEKYYGISLQGVSTLTEMCDYVVKLGQDITGGKDASTISKDAVNITKMLCQGLGIPLNNALKIKDGIVKWATDIKNAIGSGELVIDSNEKSVARATRMYDNGNTKAGDEMLKELYDEKYEDYLDKGYTETEAKKKAEESIRGSIYDAYRDEYKEAYLNGDTATMSQIKTSLSKYGYGVNPKYSDWEKSADEAKEREERAKNR